MQSSKVIKDADKKIRECFITFVRKKGTLSSRNIVETAKIETAKIDGLNVFKILKIEYITKEQQKVFENPTPRLVITGCVGSGKSLVLIARFLHKKLTQVSSKMALLVFNQEKLVEYAKIFKDAYIEVTEVNEDKFDPETLKNGVVIIHCNTNKELSQIPDVFKKLPSDTTVYIDDAHASSTCFADLNWESLSVDLSQSHLARHQGAPNWDLSKLDVNYLNRNYRSTP